MLNFTKLLVWFSFNFQIKKVTVYEWSIKNISGHSSFFRLIMGIELVMGVENRACSITSILSFFHFPVSDSVCCSSAGKLHDQNYLNPILKLLLISLSLKIERRKYNEDVNIYM